MTYHTTGGHYTSVINSTSVKPFAPIRSITGPHWAVWVFGFGAALLAVPPPWGDPNKGPFEEHEDLHAGVTRVAVAGVWKEGFLGDPGVGRIYFDPRPNGEPTVPNLEQDLQALLARIAQIPPGNPDPSPPPANSSLRQLALFTYIFNHLSKGPFAPFHQLKMLPPRVTSITITRAFPPATGTGAEDELIVAQVANVGGFSLRPYRGDDGAPVRYTNGEPQLRDDIYQGEARDVSWADADLFQLADVDQAKVSSPVGEGREFDWQWAAVHGPDMTGDPNV